MKRAIYNAIRERFPMPKRVAVHFKAALADLHNGPYWARLVAEANPEHFPEGYFFGDSTDILANWFYSLPDNVAYCIYSGYIETSVYNCDGLNYSPISSYDIAHALFGRDLAGYL